MRGAMVDRNCWDTLIRDASERIRVSARDSNAQSMPGTNECRHRHQLEVDPRDLMRNERERILALERVIWPDDAIRGILVRHLSVYSAQPAFRQIANGAFWRPSPANHHK